MGNNRYKISQVDGPDGSLAELLQALRAAGCDARVERLNSGTYLDVSVPEGIQKRATRNAGAKRQALPEGSPLAGMTEAKAQAWAAKHDMNEVAEALGVSIATAYRRKASGRLL